MKKIQNTLIGAAIALASFQASALPFAGVDARSLAMGGTGVAAGSIANASTFNPALLAAAREDEDFNLSVALGVLARDDGMIDAIDDLQAPNGFGNDLITQFSSDLTTYEAAVTTSIGNGAADAAAVTADTITEAAAVQTSASDLTTALNAMNNKPIEIGVTVGVNLTVPGESLGISVFANSRIIAAGAITNIDQDTVLITNIVNDITTGDITALDNITDPFAGGTTANTQLSLTGGAVTEVGVALATKFLGIAVGVTPKTLQIEAIEVVQNINSTNTNDVLDTTESFSDANFDVGVAMDLGLFKIGAVGKNMIEKEYTLTSGNTIIIEPQLRAGISFDAGWATLTMDQDLTVNKGLVNTGIAAIDELSESQYTSLGIEFDLALLQIRAGMRSDNTGNTEDVLTAGIGIHALATMEFAVAGNDQGVEAVFQFGLRW